MNSVNPTSLPQRPFDPSYLFRLWFGLRQPVNQTTYAASGFGLMALKYTVEAVIVFMTTFKSYLPWDFINPLISVRQKYFTPPAPEWLAWAFILWSLPFLWIAVSMSVRRAVDAGKNAWLGLWVFVLCGRPGGPSPTRGRCACWSSEGAWRTRQSPSRDRSP